jgi:glucose/arabinose dehydrogenase
MRAFPPRRPSPRLALLCAVAALALSGCNDQGGDPARQIGANPVLPEPQHYLLPPMHVAKTAPWAAGEKPSVPAGLKIEALAPGLQHPRALYVLPNGDVLVVESSGPKAPVNRPKDLVMGWVPAPAPRAEIASPCCATSGRTASPRRAPSSSTISPRRSAWPSSATTSMWPTPMR